MTELWGFLLRHGYGLLFAAVLVEQLGAPVPAAPMLMVMGALVGLGYYSFHSSLLLAVVACVAADLVWYELGRRRGDSILNSLCRLSLEPDTCVRKTSRALEEWGPASLLVAKFVPGLSTVAPPLAGSAGLSRARFLAFDTIGSAVWAGTALGAGVLLREEVRRVFEWLPHLGSGFLAAIVLPLSGWIAWKFWQRSRAIRLNLIARLSPEDLLKLMDSGEDVVLVDLRSPHAIRQASAKIPGALIVPADELNIRLKDLPGGAHLVFYCT